MDPTCMKKGRHWDLFQGFSVPLSDHVTPKDRFTTMHFLASHTPWKMHGNLRLLDAWKIGKRNKCRWFFVVPFFGMAKTCPLDGTLFNGWWIPWFFWSRKKSPTKTHACFLFKKWILSLGTLAWRICKHIFQLGREPSKKIIIVSWATKKKQPSYCSWNTCWLIGNRDPYNGFLSGTYPQSRWFFPVISCIYIIYPPWN